MTDSSTALVLVDPTSVLALGPAAMHFDPEAIGDANLPPDHPQWQRDVISISSRARAMIATIVPVVVRTFAYWDHKVRDLVLGTRTLSVDPAGCYRLR